MENINNQSSYAVVRFLNRMGYPIVEIQNRYYIVSLFEEASNNSWKHMLDGKDVTIVVNSFLHINELDESQRPAIIQKIESCPQVKKYFHKDIIFVLHLQ